MSTTGTPLTTSVVEGIDVSSNQGTIDWERVASAGITFAYIRASDGIDWEDPKLISYAAGAKAVGIEIGAYHVLRPRRGPQDAERQAWQFLERMRRAECTLVPMLDVEDTKSTRGLPGTAWADAVRQWLNVLDNATGQLSLIYTYPGFWDGIPALHAPDLGAHPLWIAHYTPKQPAIPRPWRACRIWQYAAGAGVLGSVPGIFGHVDRDRLYGELDDIRIGAHGPCRAPVPAPDLDSKDGLAAALTLLGYKPDASLRGAVVAFQSDHQLVPDGIVGPKTRAALKAALEGMAR